MQLENPHKKTHLIILALICLMAFNKLAFGQVSEQEKNALMELYKQTNGEDWKATWNFDEPVSNWYGNESVQLAVHYFKLLKVL